MAEDNSAQETPVLNGNRATDRVRKSESTLLRQALEMGVGRPAEVTTNTRVEVHEFVQPPIDHSYVYSTQPSALTINLNPPDNSFEEDTFEGNVGQTQIISENLQTFPGDLIQTHAQLSPCLQAITVPQSVLEVTLPEVPLEKVEIPFLLDNSASIDTVSVCIHDPPNNIPPNILTQDTSISVKSETQQKIDSIKQLKLHTKPDAPLGSSDNPIQVLHQGNSFRPTQALSKAQLQQITHVLQQRQLLKAIHNGGKSELYDKTTNTRILYKVIYPRELQTQSEESANSPENNDTVETIKVKGKPRKSLSKKGVDDKGKPILSKEERDEKKKHRPRTRSGRISKPPSYMVKDYKRIHHLDFNEEPYDASDGGYSDFQVSDEENEKRGSKGSLTGVSTSKQRNYNCASCSKAYIGRGGLSRHYKLNPSHGSLPEGEDASTQDENSNSSFASSVFNMSASSMPGSTNPPPSPFKPDSNGTSQQLPFTLQDIAVTKRKAKLKELLKNYSDEEVVEACLPKLLQSISLWEFLLIKSKKGNSQQPDVPSLFKYFESVVTQMQKVARTFLTSTCFPHELNKTVLNVTNDAVAKAVLINPGSYFVKDLKMYSTEQQLNSMGLSMSTCNENRAAIDDTMVSPIKRRKVQLESPMVDVAINPTLPDQILSDMTQEVENIELQTLASVAFQDSATLQQDPSNILNVISANAENHPEFVSRSMFDCGNIITSGAHRVLQTVGNSTTVTPSSLSSGCLSAIDASEALKNHNFTPTSSISQLQNTQIQHVPLFEPSLQNFHSENTIAALQNFSGNNSVQQPVVLSGRDRTESSVSMFGDNVNAYSQCPNSIALSNDNNIVYNQDMESNASVNLISTSAMSLLENKNIACNSLMECQSMDAQGSFNESGMESGCLVRVNNVPGELQTDNTVIQESAVSVPLQPNTPGIDADRQSASATGVPTDGQFTQIVDGIPIVRQLVLPDGQVISVWSAAQSGKAYSEQFVQEYLPGNLIIVQKPDGSYEVPSDQVIPVEMLQTFLAGNELSDGQQKKDSLQSQIL